MLTFNNGYAMRASFYSAFQDVDTNELRHALVSKENEENTKQAVKMIDFTEDLQVVMNRRGR